MSQPPTLSPLDSLRAKIPDWDIWRLRFSVPDWLRQNPGLVISAIYVGASLIGVLYNYQLFRRFRISVLEFSEASDFLMVVIRDPLTVALALAGIPFYVVYMATAAVLTGWVRKRFPKLAGSPEKQQRGRELMKRWAGEIQFLFIATYAMLFVLLYSKRQADRIRSGEHYRVKYEYKLDIPVKSREPMTASLVGTTGRYVFVYHKETREVEAIPVESIARMSWDARTQKERKADAEKDGEKEAVSPP